jgi:thiol-disulfide isomerase/thioredoxin
LLFCILLIQVQACRDTSGDGDHQAPQSNPEAVDFQLMNLDGEEIRLSDFSGEVVVLNFWATWCFPCRIEIPHLIDLYSRYRFQGLTVIGVALDTVGPELIKEFVREMNINYPVLIGNEKIANDFGGIFGIPTTFVIDQERMIQNRYVGLADESVLERDILALLKK